MKKWRNAARQERSRIALLLMWTWIAGTFVAGIPAALAQTYQARETVAEHDDGKSLFATCAACHALAPGHNGRGPTLYHLFGRMAGTVPGYDYSFAMKKAGIVWREDNLVNFISNPQRLVPGTTMKFAAPADYQQIRALIEYLRTATR
jgi:cytochrome c